MFGFNSGINLDFILVVSLETKKVSKLFQARLIKGFLIFASSERDLNVLAKRDFVPTQNLMTL